jgi:hypothetical protein
MTVRRPKVGKELALGQITDDIIDSWADRFEKREDGYYCRDCGSQVMQTTCHVSIHLKEFEPKCAGPGEVKKINYPYCPKCDGDIDFARACYHVSLVKVMP